MILPRLPDAGSSKISNDDATDGTERPNSSNNSRTRCWLAESGFSSSLLVASRASAIWLRFRDSVCRLCAFVAFFATRSPSLTILANDGRPVNQGFTRLPIYRNLAGVEL